MAFPILPKYADRPFDRGCRRGTEKVLQGEGKGRARVCSGSSRSGGFFSQAPTFVRIPTQVAYELLAGIGDMGCQSKNRSARPPCEGSVARSRALGQSDHRKLARNRRNSLRPVQKAVRPLDSEGDRRLPQVPPQPIQPADVRFCESKVCRAMSGGRFVRREGWKKRIVEGPISPLIPTRPPTDSWISQRSGGDPGIVPQE